MENNEKQQEDVAKFQKELEYANQQRQGAIQALKGRLASLLSNGDVNVANMSPASVSAHRDAAQALNLVYQTLEGHDKLVDMLIHDLTGVIQVVEEQNKNLVQTAAFTQALLSILKARGFTTDAELQEAWKELVKTNLTPPTQG